MCRRQCVRFALPLFPFLRTLSLSLGSMRDVTGDCVPHRKILQVPVFTLEPSRQTATMPKTESTTNHMSEEQMKQELERLRAENAALKQTSAKGLSMKISEKGGLSIYGLGRFPVTLYKEQWKKLLDLKDDIMAFLAANDAQLKTKEAKETKE